MPPYNRGMAQLDDRPHSSEKDFRDLLLASFPKFAELTLLRTIGRRRFSTLVTPTDQAGCLHVTTLPASPGKAALVILELLSERRPRSAALVQARNPRQLPRAEKGAAPMPWERPAVGSSPKGKGRRDEPLTANASEILAQAERRQGGKVKDDEPIVVPF